MPPQACAIEARRGAGGPAQHRSGQRAGAAAMCGSAGRVRHGRVAGCGRGGSTGVAPTAAARHSSSTHLQEELGLVCAGMRGLHEPRNGLVVHLHGCYLQLQGRRRQAREQASGGGGGGRAKGRSPSAGLCELLRHEQAVGSPGGHRAGPGRRCGAPTALGAPPQPSQALPRPAIA